MHAMPALGQRGDHRLEVPEIGEVPRDEQDLHAGVSRCPAVRSPSVPSAPTGSTARRSATANRPAFKPVIRAHRDRHVRVQPFRIDEQTRGIDAEARRQPRDAAAGADERLGAGNDLRLHAEIVARGHPRSRADHASSVGEFVVGMIVFEHEPGIEQHDRQPLRQRLHGRAQVRANLRRIGHRPRGIELHRDVFLRQQRRIDHLRRRGHRLKPQMRVHEAHRALAGPVQREQPVHQARVQHVEVAGPDPPRHRGRACPGRAATSRSAW